MANVDCMGLRGSIYFGSVKLRRGYFYKNNHISVPVIFFTIVVYYYKL